MTLFSEGLSDNTDAKDSEENDKLCCVLYAKRLLFRSDNIESYVIFKGTRKMDALYMYVISSLDIWFVVCMHNTRFSFNCILYFFAV